MNSTEIVRRTIVRGHLVPVVVVVAVFPSPSASFAGVPIYPVPFAAGQGNRLASSDLDGDADLDLVAAGANGLLAFHNDGTGGLSLHQTDSTHTSLQSIVIGNLDADAAPDALARSLTTVFAYRGNGAGGFLPPLTLLVGSQYGPPQLGDFDEDGKQDVVVGNTTVGLGLTVFFGTGAGPVNPPVVTAGGLGGGSIILVADIDHDAHLDVIDIGSGLNVWRGDGQGNFQNSHSVSAGVATSAALGDFDHDGHTDLLLQSLFAGSVVNFLKGDGLGAFAAPVATALPVADYWPLDLDLDGALDLVALDPAKPGIVRLFFATGPVQFTASLDLPASQSATTLEAADFDGDGRRDLAVESGYGVLVMRGLANGSFAKNESYSQLAPTAVRTGDLDDDGFDDLVTVRGASQIGVRLNLGGSSFGHLALGPPVGFTGAQFLDLADLDLDGDLDALVLTSAGELNAFLGDGVGALAFAQSGLAFSSGAQLSLHAQDVSQDGIADASLAFTVSGGISGTFAEVQYQAGSGSGTFGSPQSVAQISQLGADLHVADFNGDSAGDFVITFSGSTPRYIASNGAGGFLAPAPIALAGPSATRVASGDLNGDGVLDLVLTEQGVQGIVHTLLGSGGGFVEGTTTTILEHSANDTSLACADADGDGRLDVLVLGDAVGTTPVLDVLRGNGTGALQTFAKYAVASKLTGSRIRTFDAEHDGRVDVVLVSAENHRVEVLRNALPDYFTYIGSGCPGSGGFLPRLRLDGVATPGGSVTLRLENGLGGATALLFSGTQNANVPLPGGCPLLTFPLLPLVFNLSLSGFGAGQGAFHLAGPLPGALGVGSSYVLQALVLDAGAPFGFAATNAAKFLVQ